MKKYTFSDEEKQEIKKAREKNRDKNVEKRIEALALRAEGKRNKEISEKTGFHTQYITVLVSRYKSNGLSSITENHYHGNRRNLSYEEEEAVLEPFRQAAKAGKMVSVRDIEAAYREALVIPSGQARSITFCTAMDGEKSCREADIRRKLAKRSSRPQKN